MEEFTAEKLVEILEQHSGEVVLSACRDGGWVKVWMLRIESEAGETVMWIEGGE